MANTDRRLARTGHVRATMADVGALAGVSAKTVSRVVTGNGKVSDAVRARVTDAIERLNYRPDLAASRLRSGASGSAAIGLLLVDISNPFSSSLHRVIEDQARTRELVVLAASTDEDPERERAAVNAFTARRVDGLLMMPSSHDQSYLQAEIRAGTPVVMLDRQPSYLNVDAVVSDNRGGSRQGVEHLLQYGHRRIAYLGDRAGIFSSHERFGGYREALERAGIAIDPHLIVQGFDSPDDVTAAVHRMSRAHNAPTAYLLGQNLICAPAVRALKQLGLERSTAVVGFDGFEAADLVEPGLTTISQDPHAMGRRGAEILFERLDGSDRPYAVETLPTTLFPRGSGEVPADQ